MCIRDSLYVGQIDAVYPLSEVWKVQAGVKTSFVTIDNTAGYMLSLIHIFQLRKETCFVITEFRVGKLAYIAGTRFGKYRINGK